MSESVDAKVGPGKQRGGKMIDELAALRAENDALRAGLEHAGRALENVGMAPYAQARKEIAALLGSKP